MKTILNKLHDDHKNFLRLLLFLEEQHKLLEDCEYSDLSSTLNAIRYMKEYPDHVHHPLENAVFQYFLENHDEAHKEITELLQEHGEMPLLTNKLLEMLEGVLADVPQSREELCAYLKKYISVQKEHMNQEEAHVYPILKEKLDEKDWQRINSELSHIEDPLFGTMVKESYQGLLQQIVG